MNAENSTKLMRFLVVLVLFMAVPSIVHAADHLSVGSGHFVFTDLRGNKDKPVTVWYYSPKEFEPNTPVVFVMHGVKRNGQEYRDAWVEHARKGQFLLLVPEFSEKHYPKSRSYNLGNMFSSKGRPIERSKWTYTAVEHIFSYVKKIGQIRTKTYSIYGHSAGAQFVHRLVLFVPDSHVKTAICANAGWYTMPTTKHEFPYGLRKTRISRKGLKKSFSQKLVVLLGEKDTDENHKHLRKTKEAMAQGKHRFERGTNFFNTAKRESTKVKAPFKWQFKEVKGVGHSNSGMAKAAAKLLL